MDFGNNTDEYYTCDLSLCVMSEQGEMWKNKPDIERRKRDNSYIVNCSLLKASSMSTAQEELQESTGETAVETTAVSNAEIDRLNTTENDYTEMKSFADWEALPDQTVAALGNIYDNVPA